MKEKVTERVFAEMVVKKQGFIISEATMKVSDLLKVAHMILNAYSLNPALRVKIEELFQHFMVSAYDTLSDELDLDRNEDASYLWNEEIFNYFNKLAPPNYYFGSHEGDGACYGWFECREEC
jgi:hypothetical protein